MTLEPTNPGPGRVIAVANLKGGVGKTTVSMLLAGYFHAGGQRTCIVDADDQGTTRAWAELGAGLGAANPTVLNLGKGEAMLSALRELRADWRIIIVDCPPRLGGQTLAAMTRADLLLMPLAPVPADAWALAETLSILAHARHANPGVIARAVFNRTDRSALGRVVAGDIRQAGIELCASELRSRIPHTEAMARGQTIQQHAPSSDAEIEARRLGAEVEALLLRGAAA